MSGYTPVFGSLFQGSLCGQWPELPVFCTLLPLADKNGHLDYSFAYLSAVTGWPEDLLRQGIAALERADPASRNPDDNGRRLTRLRDNTEWGWRIVNHGYYREKARLSAKNAREVESGKEADRKRYQREMSAGVRRCPPVSDPSNANTNSDVRALRSSSSKSVRPSSSERGRTDLKIGSIQSAVATAADALGVIPR